MSSVLLLLENYQNILMTLPAGSQVNDHCLFGYLFVLLYAHIDNEIHDEPVVVVVAKKVFKY